MIAAAARRGLGAGARLARALGAAAGGRPPPRAGPEAGAGAGAGAERGEDEHGAYTVVRVDRSGLPGGGGAGPAGPAGPLGGRHTPGPLTEHLAAKIRLRGGPITMAEYMEEVLTHPAEGFYMHRDVFGAAGDFVTSPEVSQMFGELVGVWFAVQWQQLGRPERCRLVEVGPGRGTLMADLLRGTRHVPGFHEALEIHLVEVSPTNRRLQRAALCGGGEGEGPREVADGAECRSAHGPRVAWHSALGQVPGGRPTLVLMHEFLDALPVHQFQHSDRGWSEVLVAAAADGAGGGGEASELGLVLSPGETVAARTLLPVLFELLEGAGPERASQRLLEVSPKALALVQDLSRRLEADEGAALVVDYGKRGPMGHTLQAIRRHKVVDVLDQPGSADLSAHVDFELLECAVKQVDNGVRAWGG